MEPLTADQVEYAHELLEELHPIENTPICRVFPVLGYLCCCLPDWPKDPKKAEQVDNEAPLVDGKKDTLVIAGKEVKKKGKKPKKNNVGEEAQKADALAQLGFGIVAYIDMLHTLVWTLALFSVMLIPTFMSFQSGTAYGEKAITAQPYISGYLGNLGYSSVQCSSIPADLGTLAVSCPYGTVGAVLDYGLNKELSDRTTCVTNDDNESCKPNNMDYLKGLTTQVTGVQSTSISFDINSMYSLPASMASASPTAKQAYLDAQVAACYTPGDSTFFMQYTCVQSDEQIEKKYNEMCLVVATGALMCMWFTVMVKYLYQGGKIKQLQWDMSTVTAGDYTVELTIKKANYAEWNANEYRKPGGDFENGVAPAMSLKRHLKQVIESTLDDFVDKNPWILEELNGKNKKKSDGTASGYVRTKIADIVFSFDNADLILALRARGAQIAAQDFDAMRAEEQKINELFQQFEKLTVPTSAFITFERDDSKEYILLMSEKGNDQTIIGQKFEFKETSEPTDIIWENRHYTQKDYFWRQVWAFLIIGALLVGSFIVIYVISAFSARLSAVFPANQNCADIEATYGNQLETYAVSDYEYIYGGENEGKPGSGCLKCWCTDQYDANGSDSLKVEYQVTIDGETQNAKICDAFAKDVSKVLFWTSALSYILIGINYVLRTVCIMLVDWIGFSTETVRLSKTTTVTFIVQFFNSAFLLLMTNANLSEQRVSFGLTAGSFSDFNTLWFRSVGDIIVGAMMFNLYYPIIEVIMYWAMRVFFRCLDRGCTLRGPTKSTSIQGYISTYQGPLYFMHYKYSSVLTTVFITFMYGLGMPILFPIAAGSMLVLFYVEKLMLFYGYVMPPMYDERLSQDVLTKLQFAPLLYCLFGYWMASNQQLLSNAHLKPVDSTTSIDITEHPFSSVFHATGWEGVNWPLLVTLIMLTIIYYFGGMLEKWVYQCIPYLQIGDIELNEDIDNYWAALDDEDRKWSTREEANARDALKMSILTDEQHERLLGTPKTEGKTLQGTHSYDILANPLYLDDFQYVTAAEDDRDEVIIDDDDDEGNDAAQSDLVRLCLNLAFMTEQQARNFKFSKDGLKTTLEGIKPTGIQ